ncbi:hypothetical protein K466DRAFT_564750 [Polyporus arcularius HHB13444]|uniref:HNH nuclease domain-containing protein n=1 Tax=Polyporus arcularius HHB13444 TaxID=1314778 RepID=A0A5C3PJU6_9APHY|nr:hypothetical protein K466DRAFT_564750 [Polyporus arcularius HHB13444]
MSTPHILRDHRLLLQVTDSIFNDPDLEGSELYRRATACLEVLDHREFQRYNKPSWIPASVRRNSDFSIKRLIEAFYHTAQDLHLSSGSRYIVASVCACDRLVDTAVDGNLSTSTGLSRSELLARELSMMASDMWYAQMSSFLWSPIDNDECCENVRQQLLVRDAFACFKTGSMDVQAPRSPFNTESRQQRLEPTPILQGAWLEQSKLSGCTCQLLGTSLSDGWAVDFLDRFLEIKIPCVPANSPRNNLLLAPMAAASFHSYMWTLKPTQTPDRYKVIDHSGSRMIGGGVRNGDYITFAAKRRGIEPPDRDYLLVHAAYTSILHRSGFSWWMQVTTDTPLMEHYLGSDEDDIGGHGEGDDTLKFIFFAKARPESWTMIGPERANRSNVPSLKYTLNLKLEDLFCSPRPQK